MGFVVTIDWQWIQRYYFRKVREYGGPAWNEEMRLPDLMSSDAYEAIYLDTMTMSASYKNS